MLPVNDKLLTTLDLFMHKKSFSIDKLVKKVGKPVEIFNEIR